MKRVFVATLLLVILAVCSASYRSCIDECRRGKFSDFARCGKGCVVRYRPEEMKAMEDEETAVLADVESANSEIDNNAIWESMRHELEKFFTRGTFQPGLRMTQKYINAESFDDVTALSTFCDFVPKFSPVYEYNMDASFRSEYENFLNSIAGVQRRVNPALDDLAARVDQAAFDQEVEEAMCRQRYDDLKPDFKRLFPTYEGYSARLCSNAQRKTRELADLNAELLVLSRREYGTFADLIAASLKLKESKNTFPQWRLLESIKTFKKEVEEGKGNAFEVFVGKSQSKSQSKWSKFGISVGYSFPSGGAPNTGTNIGVSVSFGQSKFKLTTSGEDLKVGIRAAHYQYFTAVPSATWFTQGVIKQYMDSQYAAGKSKDYFFGARGRVPFMLKGFYVVAKPAVDLYVNKYDSEQISKSTSMGISVSIGPVSVGVSGEKGAQVTKQNENTYKVTLTSDSVDPQIWAVDVNFFDQNLANAIASA